MSNNNGICLPDFSEWVEIPKGGFLPAQVPTLEINPFEVVTYYPHGLTYTAGITDNGRRFFVEHTEPRVVVTNYRATLGVVSDLTTGEILDHFISRDEGLTYLETCALEDEYEVGDVVPLSNGERDALEERYMKYLGEHTVPLGDLC